MKFLGVTIATVNPHNTVKGPNYIKRSQWGNFFNVVRDVKGTKAL